jgi:hypothetical protein
MLHRAISGSIADVCSFQIKRWVRRDDKSMYWIGSLNQDVCILGILSSLVLYKVELSEMQNCNAASVFLQQVNEFYLVYRFRLIALNLSMV